MSNWKPVKNREKYGWPRAYSLYKTALFFTNPNHTWGREIPYHFHTNPMCASNWVAGSGGDTIVTEVSIFQNDDNEELFYVKPQDQMYQVVEECGQCLWSVHRLLEPLGDWVADAACADMEPGIFFPESPTKIGGQPNYGLPRRICRSCDVQRECLDYALRTRQTYGMWGGTTPTQRKRMRASQD